MIRRAGKTDGARGGETMTAFFDDLERYANAAALIDETGVIVSYAELARRANAFAAAVGDRPHLMLLAFDNSVDAVVAYVGALRGRHPVILTADSGVAADRLAAAFGPDIVARGTQITARSPHDEARLHPDLAVLLSTSGSTGSAKLVRLSAAAVDANARSIAEFLEIGPGERAITTLPPSYSYGLSVVNSHLASGASLLLTARSVIDPGLWELARHHGATSLAGVPYTYELLEKIGFRDMDLPALRTLTQAGGRLSLDLVRLYADWAEAPGRRFVTMYGQTEATARIAWLPPADLPRLAGAIGRAIPGGTLALRPVDGQPAHVGELIYTGPNVMMGYATSAADLARGAELGELATGDLAEMVEPGTFRIVGRLGRFAKIAGLRVGFDDIEAILGDAGIEARVAGNDSGVAVALVAASDDDRARAASLIAARTTIPANAVAVITVPEWPRLVSGKIDYASLIAAGAAARRDDAERSRAAAGASPIAAAFAPLLGGNAAAPGDSFTSLHGDSLSYVQVSMDIERALGDLPANWETLTIAQLEAAVPAEPRASALRTIPGEMLVRVAAIATVVAGHIGDMTALKGGGAVLLMTADYNLSRFQGARLAGPDRWRIVGNLLERVVLPAYLMILLIAGLSASASLSLPTLLLVSSYAGENRGPLLPFWFIETLLHAMIVTVALYSFAPVRRFAVESPWRFALALLGVAVAAKLIVPTLVVIPQIAENERTLDAWGYAFALGLVLAAARTSVQKLACVALAAGLAAWDWEVIGSHTLWLAGATAVVLFAPRIRLWRPLANAVSFLAQISFYIYITHMLAIQIVRWQLHLTSPVLALALSVVLGAAFYFAWEAFVRQAGAMLRQLRGRARPTAAA